jgi:hypothetical protein
MFFWGERVAAKCKARNGISENATKKPTVVCHIILLFLVSNDLHLYECDAFAFRRHISALRLRIEFESADYGMMVKDHFWFFQISGSPPATDEVGTQ